MLYSRTTLGLAVALLLCIASIAHSQDLAALKASFAAEVEALNLRKLDLALAPIDDRIVLFGIFSPFPIVRKEGFRQAVQDYFDDYEQAVFRPIDPDFKIIATTGIAWGHFRLATRRKDGPQEYSDGRYMFTYTQADGQWRIICMHYSLLQPLVK